jgi:REP element-mobilizing transposase RayT
MAGTFSQILLHIVFSTKGRQPWITDEVALRLYPYIGGIVRDEGSVLLDSGGVEDHMHLYVRGRTDISIPDLLRNVKSRSSQWVHQTFPRLRDFAWQEGYSVSP